MPLRKPVVAGSFYEKGEKELKEQIEECFLHRLGPGKLPKVEPQGKRKILGLVSPHAGYMYSGPPAAQGFYHLAQDGIPEIIVILGPNHRGVGTEVALFAQGSWETPLGKVKINEEIAGKIAESSEVIEVDETAHLGEHSLEVQVPFLQYIYGSNFSLLPICMMSQDIGTVQKLGETLAQVLSGENAVIIASTDFTHREPQEAAQRKDKEALEEILNLNPQGLLKVVNQSRISMCGPGPVATMLTAAKTLGAEKAELLKYSTSGDIIGDYSGVVGYASVKVCLPY
jgi:AmmeMemoRadiSam system protein B